MKSVEKDTCLYLMKAFIPTSNAPMFKNWAKMHDSGGHAPVSEM